jgi:hypothetical protein
MDVRHLRAQFRDVLRRSWSATRLARGHADIRAVCALPQKSRLNEGVERHSAQHGLHAAEAFHLVSHQNHSRHLDVLGADPSNHLFKAARDHRPVASPVKTGKRGGFIPGRSIGDKVRRATYEDFVEVARS